MNLLVLLGAQSSSAVRQLDVQLLSALDDQLASLGRNSMSDLAAVDTVLHEQEVEFLNQFTSE
jgi:hypothetical protein